MKQLSKSFAFILSATLIISACSKNADTHSTPQEDNLPGTYTADFSYKKDSSTPAVTRNNAPIVITESGGLYDLHFPENVPDINAVEMKKEEDGYTGTVEGYSGFIRITGGRIEISITRNNENWFVMPVSDTVAGTYTGSISYTKNNPTSVRVKTNARIVITAAGNKYDIHFPDNIPDISGATMVRETGGYSGSVTGYTGTIQITGNRLEADLTNGNEKWKMDARL